MSSLAEIRVRCHARRLDAVLVDGADPAGSDELALRAKRLTSAAFRADLATSLERAVRVAPGGHGRGRLVQMAAIQPPVDVALRAGPAVRRLADRLRSADDVRAGGVALALRLITDGGSPLYVGPTIAEVLVAVHEIEAAL